MRSGKFLSQQWRGAENDRWRDSLALNVLGLAPGCAQATRSQRLLAVVLTGIGQLAWRGGAGRGAGSVPAWCFAAEARDELLGLALTALGARSRPLLQAVMFADRDADLKVLAARLAIDS